jgi:two-component system phosphate regulon sensor histidine kinase PhoR
VSAIAWRVLRAPGAVAVAALAAAFAGGADLALAVVAAGAIGILAFHLWHVARLSAWTNAPSEVEVPEGHGVWRPLFASIYRHVRARDTYERNLRQMIERFRQAASAIPDGIVVLDAANGIDWANPRAVAQFGLDLAIDRGRPIVNLVRQPEFRRHLESADYAASVVVQSDREPGRTLALSLVPFATDQKLLMARDITDLEAVARMRRDFIASASHELKTPLTVISGFLETLREQDVDAPSRRRFIELMSGQAASMQRLVGDLMTLSALESEGNPLHEESFAVAPLLDGLVTEARALSQGAHTIAVESSQDAVLLGSREEIASAFGNLVSNAVRYTPAGGTIELSWRLDPDGNGVFAVRDTGIGIAAEHVPRLTERFYRVDRSRSRATGGTGLGLAIVKHVLLRHRAELVIESELDKGSTFAVRWPAERIARAGAPAH